MELNECFPLAGKSWPWRRLGLGASNEELEKCSPKGAFLCPRGISIFEVLSLLGELCLFYLSYPILYLLSAQAGQTLHAKSKLVALCPGLPPN